MMPIEGGLPLSLGIFLALLSVAFIDWTLVRGSWDRLRKWQSLVQETWALE